MYKAIKTFYLLTVLFSVMTLTGSIGLLLRILSLGFLLNFNRRYLIAYSSRCILYLLGMKIVMPETGAFPKQKCLITFNHNSNLDVLLLTAIGLTNTRFILSEGTLHIIPVTISSLAIGVVYIPKPHQNEKRLRFFKKLEKKINTENNTIAASSEGVHEFIDGIAKFNKGIYHIATVCKLDIVPLYIYIPRESNPFRRYATVKGGTLICERLETVDTHNWKVEDIEENKELVRAIFIDKFNALNEKR